ncbi:MAG: flotillin family protein [Phycisphaerales bacterium]|nr:flotillin family protein [Phycisphaerae bacterium]NNM24775.1 flotillin family protein [Phycisphaerales bacterium]
MSTHLLAANPLIWTGLVAAVALMLVFGIAFIATRYKRCPSNRILVVYGRVGGARAAKCCHGGGAFVLPLIQDYAFLGLEPLVIDIPLEGALSLNNIRVNVPATFTVGVSTDPVLMNAAAERLLMLDEKKIRDQAQDIILGQLRLVIATLSIEEINKDREKFMSLINENVTQEINKIGLALINVNVRDITDESGYIVAIGQRAAAEAINRAKVEVAEQDRDGSVGEAMAQREMRVTVAEREAETVTGRKRAEQEQRIQVADAESVAVDGENTARATIAESNAKLAEIEAEAERQAEVARSRAAEAIFEAQREQELARLSKEELAAQEIEKQRIEIAAEAEAERQRREARGEADAILARFEAEAAGLRKVLQAKADGYRELVEACRSNPEIAPTLLMIEQLPTLVAEQVKAIQNLKIDKITVWDSGAGGGEGRRGATAGFLSGLIGSLPAMHELADQAGIELPTVLGRLHEADPSTLTRSNGRVPREPIEDDSDAGSAA